MGDEEKKERRRLLKKQIEEEVTSLKMTLQDLRAKVGEGKELAAKVDAIVADATTQKTALDASVQGVVKTVTTTQAQLETSKVQIAEITALKANAQTNAAQLQQLATSAASSKTELSTAVSQLEEKTAALDKLKTDFGKWQKTAADAHNELKTANETQYAELVARINSLLPGATSVGLAKSFEERRSSYWKPRLAWALAGIGALVAIILLATLQGQNILTVESWSQFGLVLTRKLPVVLPLIWIAYFGFHQFGILSRIEEEYAHKEAVSKAFEGYKTQLKEEIDPKTAKSLEKLVGQTLDALAKQPAEAYDTKSKPVMPSDELLGKLADLAKALGGAGGQTESPISTKWAIAGGSVGGALVLLILSMAWKLFFGMPPQNASISLQEVRKPAQVIQPASSPAKP